MANETTALAALYTLTPLHVGTGQATGAIDLPVARESHTGLPIVPATALKGVWRDVFEQLDDQKRVERLFGPELKQDSSGSLQAGGLVLTEAHCLALPLRSASIPFVYATSLLVLERLVRNLDAFGVRLLENFRETIAGLQPDRVYVADKDQDNTNLLVEDLFFQEKEVFFSSRLQEVAQGLAGLLPEQEKETRARLVRNLVLLPDGEFSALVDQALPVQARIHLGDNKSASADGGNLWYEESVPADTLFAYFLRNRPGHKDGDPVQDFLDAVTDAGRSRTLQIGGNETVGQGWFAVTQLEGGAQ